MKKLRLILLLLISQTSLAASSISDFDYENFANDYFEIWTATQTPSATKDNVDKYLALLVENVGHQHFPYDTDDNRDPKGKELMRKGMLHYLGGHQTYKAQLLNITYGTNAIVIKYTEEATYLDSNGKPASWQHTMLEVLELEGGKVSIIRKYS